MAIRRRWGIALSNVKVSAWNTFEENWHLGFTSFGGPPVHFKIFHDRFVRKLEWIEEQMYQELFSVCQCFSGPSSTKMLYCINLIHGGFLSALLGLLIWSLPGALGMYGLSIGVSNFSETLPRQVYPLLSGLNAATVGVILLAAVELSRKVITDKLTRLLVFLTGAAGVLYNALWYFPVLMLVSGLATLIFDLRWLHGPVKKLTNLVRCRRRVQEEVQVELPQRDSLPQVEQENEVTVPNQRPSEPTAGANRPPTIPVASSNSGSTTQEPRIVPSERRIEISWKLGLAVIICFFVSFAIVMVLRGVLSSRALLYRFFANMYLAGTIIFGGGPVVIPLLSEYVVAEGWVSPRDFLVGLAIIQAFPGPNSNFAVYLGSLTAVNAGYNSAAGAILGYLGIFAPGLILVHGTMGIWSALRGMRSMKSLMRGMNAGAVGLIYTAVYRLWQTGNLGEGYRDGTSLAVEPWWVVVTATSFVGGMWFDMKPPLSITLGAAMGMTWYVIALA